MQPRSQSVLPAFLRHANTAALALVILAGCDRSSPPAPTTVSEPAPAPIATNVPDTTATIQSAISKARALRAEGKLAEARELLQQHAGTPDAPHELLELLGQINTQIVFTTAPAPEKVDHTVVEGDTLGKLARKFNTTIELIKKSNGLTSDTIRIGDRLRIYQGKFAVEISKAANTLTVTDHGKFFKRYRVGTGQDSRTPVGEFKITSRIHQPPWFRPDGQTIPYGHPDNILGTHWLGLNLARYGIHGTWDTNSIGRQSSAGCIRLLNEDVAELYLLLPVGTPVVIRD